MKPTIKIPFQLHRARRERTAMTWQEAADEALIVLDNCLDMASTELAAAYAEIERLEQIIEGTEPEPGPGPGPGPEPVPLPVGGRAISTFHCMGLYWNPPVTLKTNTGVPVRYREVTAKSGEWRTAFDIHYDARAMTDYGTSKTLEKARGSIVGLKSGTEYEMQFGVRATDGSIEWHASLRARTWSETFKVSRTVCVTNRENMLPITEGGSKEAGFVVYDGGGSATIDVHHNADWCVKVDCSYVIVRGLTLKGGRRGCVQLGLGVTDVVVEENDMSDWGTKRESGNLGDYGIDYQAAVTNQGDNTTAYIDRMKEHRRFVIQRNKIYDPSFGTNDWDEGHPEGPQAIYLRSTGGNHVIRYNHCYATEKDPARENRYYNDILGGEDNADARSGFPGNDSDVYGNDFDCSMDDCIEAEGHGCNARIWGNRIANSCAAHIATNVTHVGPIYIYRNILASIRPGSAPDRYPNAIKTGDRNGYGGGRRFIFHNTTLTPPHLERAIDDVSDTVNGLYVRNNIWAVARNNTYTVQGSDNSIDYNMSDKTSVGECPSGTDAHGIKGATALYKVGANGDYQLRSDSPGKGKAEPIPNFNKGVGADMGAHEEGAPLMLFGPDQ